MDKFLAKRYGKNGPEWAIREAIKKYLEYMGWYVQIITGNKFQSGLPDLYATHPVHKGRWIEVKLPDMEGSRFTDRQIEVFPKLIRNGTPVYILTAATHNEYLKIFGEENFTEYLTLKVLGKR